MLKVRIYVKIAFDSLFQIPGSTHIFLCFSVGHITFESNFVSAYSPEASGVSPQLSFAFGLEAKNRKTGTWNPKSFLCKCTQSSGLLSVIAACPIKLMAFIWKFFKFRLKKSIKGGQVSL